MKRIGRNRCLCFKTDCGKKYIVSFFDERFLKETIRAYGFAFEGKKVRIDGGDLQKVDSIIKTAEKRRLRRSLLKRRKFL